MSWAIWITGRPGSGKTTIAHDVADALRRRGEPAAMLEASSFVAALVPGRAPAAAELDLIHRALIYTASMLLRAGVPVIIDATAPRRAWRDLAREALEPFAEVQLVCPDAICGAREQAVRWRRMLTIGHGAPAPSEPEVVLDYEYSLRADLTVNTEAQPAWTSTEDVLGLVEGLRRRAHTVPRGTIPPPS